MGKRIPKETRQANVIKLQDKLNETKKPKPMANRNESIERLKNLRKEYSIMQEDLAEILGKSTEQIKKYENGTNNIPIDVAYDLATIFDTNALYILGYPVDRHVVGKYNITEEIGLSEESVNILYKLKHSQSDIDDRIYSESIKALDFINLALNHYEDKTEGSVINYIYTIFSLLQDYISFDNNGEFYACDGAMIDSGYNNRYLLYNTSVNDLPIKIDLDEYTQLILKEKIFKALDNLRTFKEKEYIKSVVEKSEADTKHAKSIPGPITIDKLESIGLEIINRDTENNSITVRRKKKK